MNTIEKLKKDLETAKLALRFANETETVVNAFRNKDEFEFTGKYTNITHNLFRRDNLIYWGRFQFNAQDIELFQDGWKFENDLKEFNDAKLKKVIKAMKFVLKHSSNSEMMEIASSLSKEINK